MLKARRRVWKKMFYETGCRRYKRFLAYKERMNKKLLKEKKKYQRRA